MFLSRYRKWLYKVLLGVALVVYGILGGPESRVSLLLGATLVVWGVIRLRGGTTGNSRKGIQR